MFIVANQQLTMRETELCHFFQAARHEVQIRTCWHIIRPCTGGCSRLAVIVRSYLNTKRGVAVETNASTLLAKNFTKLTLLRQARAVKQQARAVELRKAQNETFALKMQIMDVND